MTGSETEVIRAVPAPADASSDDEFVLMVGETPRRSAPSLTLAKALAGLGISARFADARLLTRRAWLDMLSLARGIVLVTYGEIETFLLSLLATAVAMDVPI